MGKLIIISLTLLFSILFFHAKGSIIKLESPDQVEKWYAKLHTKKLTTSKLKVFLHANNTVNQVQVAQSLVPNVTAFFGSVYSFEYMATAKKDVKSEFMGYGHGSFVVSSKEILLESAIVDFSVSMGINLSLIKYSNSTITLLGQDRFSNKYRELAVVGGSGDFRLATGSAIVSTAYRATDAAILELTIFVRHYLNG